MKKFILLFLFLFITHFSFSQQAITIDYSINEDNSINFFYKKDKAGSYTIAINFTTLENANYNPRNYVVKNQRGNLFKLYPSNKMRGISFSYEYKYTKGAYDPGKIEKDFVYLLPFGKGKELKVVEQNYVLNTYLGKENPKDWKAYRFYGKNLDSVFAIRKGIIAKVIDKIKINKDIVFTSEGNYIVIEHQDGSFALYGGFDKGKIAVKEGDKILPRDYLGVLKNENTAKNECLSLIVYYLYKFSGFKDGIKSTHAFITPTFKTKEGTIQLKEEQDYIVEFSEEDITKEMSKRERKQYKKKR